MNTNATPYADPAINALYDMLFCDQIESYRQQAASLDTYPWKSIFDANATAAECIAVMNDAALPSRIRLLASRKLPDHHIQPPHALLGVVVELGLDDGLDVLAAYRDGTARYFNYTGHVLIWETSTVESEQLIDKLFSESTRIVAQIGLWNKPRRIFPSKGMMRISFLGTDGLYFGEGPIDRLFADPFSAPALQAATALLQYLTAQKKA